MPNAAQLAAAAKKRKLFPNAVLKDRSKLFDQQLRLVTSQHRSKVVLAGRRGGKTYAAVHCAVDAASRHDGAVIPICETTTTSQSAKTFWAELVSFVERHKIDAHIQTSYHIITFPNRASIQIVGCYDTKQCDALRGGKYPRVIIDEAGTYRPTVLQYLVTEVLGAALIDLSGDLIIVGTPSALRKGYWFDICNAPDSWEKFHWTLLDNPTIGSLEKRQAELALIRARDRYTEDDPRYLREYLAQWATGTGELVYQQFSDHRNVVRELPASSGREWRYGLSVDLGYRDPTAFVVTAARDNDPHIYCLESSQDVGMTVQMIAQEIQKLSVRYRFNWIVGDAGGGGKTVVESLARDHRIPIKAAKKDGKSLAIEQVNVDLKSGRIKIIEQANWHLLEDMRRLPWNLEHDDAAENFPDHLTDAFLYGCREWGVAVSDYGDAYLKPGSDAWNHRLEQQMLETAIQQVRSQHLDDDYLDGVFDGETPDLGLPEQQFGQEQEWDRDL